MQIGGLYVSAQQIVHLVFHERYDGCDHHCHAVEQHGGHLKSNGLTPSCGHKSKCIFAFKHTVYYVFLQWSEVVVAPIPLQHVLGCQIHVRNRHRPLSLFLLSAAVWNCCFCDGFPLSCNKCGMACVALYSRNI